MSLADLDEMIEACAKNNCIFMDGVMFMHDARLEVRIKASMPDKTLYLYVTGLQYMMRSVSDPTVLGIPRRVTSAFSFCGDDAFVAGNIRMQVMMIRAMCRLEAISVSQALSWHYMGSTLVYG